MASNVVSRLRGVKSSQAIKVPCRVATTANITLSGEQTIDGVAVVDGDRVLVKDQTTASENGIYEVDTGAWDRAPDWDGVGDVVTGTTVYVTSGTVGVGFWKVTTSGTIVVGTTSVALSGGLNDSDSITEGATNLFMTVSERSKLSEIGVSITEEAYGAVAGGGTADSAANTTAIIAAATAAAGGTLIIPEGVFYIRGLITLKSNTRVFMQPGAVIKADVANWSGSNYVFRNENHSASSLTDENIHLEGFGLIDCDGMAADTHMWYMRYVDTSSVRGCIGRGGGNFTAFLACVDTLTDGAEAQDVGNCGFDHWDGAGDAIVSNCTVRGAGAQGIQATGTATDFANRDTWNVKFIGNTIREVRNVGQVASAIIFNTADAGSTNRRCLSMGNYVDDCDIGLVMSGVGGQHTSIGDTFRDVDQLPIQIQDSDGIPDNCRILFPHLIDCDHSVAANALISIAGGNNNTVDGIRVTNAGAAPYARVVIIASGAVDTYIGIERAPAGATTTVADSGTNTSYLNKIEAYGDWTSYTPTVTASTGTITTVSGAGAYKRIGKTMHWRASVNMTTNGTGADFLIVTLPADVVSLNRLTGVGIRTGDGVKVFFRNSVSKSNVYVEVLADGTYPGVDGAFICINGSYEID